MFGDGAMHAEIRTVGIEETQATPRLHPRAAALDSIQSAGAARDDQAAVDALVGASSADPQALIVAARDFLRELTGDPDGTDSRDQ
jgi:hypothetical protein